MTKLEEVAFATCSSEPCICKHRAGFEGMPCLDRARAAVEALRKPTGLMIDAGQPWSVGDAPPNCWVKMIDAILTESP